MKLIIYLLFGAQISIAGQTHPLHSSWMFQDSDKPERQLLLEIHIKSNQVEFFECWQQMSSEASSCQKSIFRLKDEKLFVSEKKVGDLFPYALVIFDSNQQRSEMMKIRLRTMDELDYTYSYSNMDGEGVFRRAHMKRVKDL